MKIPAIRAQIGIWVYYVSTLTFEQVAKYVKKVDDELHKSVLLRDMLQRSITDNYKNISNYILQQEERFFNALVLAVYDGDPRWHEVRLEYSDNEEFYDLGILELTGEEKIFPVDGQHRVEGIKKAISENPGLSDERVPVIFIGHKKDDEGMKRARRMFSTLNRYAKPVSMRDIIALDEDDVIAIVSRDLIDSMQLFSDYKIFDSKSKSIPDSNTKSFTTIITFYECNRELLWMMIKNCEVKNSEEKKLTGKSKIKQFIKFRPTDDKIEEFKSICKDFWASLTNISDEFKKYAESSEPESRSFRNKEGGNILFRPVALLPFVKAAIRIKESKGITFSEVFANFPKNILELKNIIWKNVLWNPDKKTMIMNNKLLTELILIYCYDKNLLNNKETEKLIFELKSLKQLEDNSDVITLLNEITGENLYE
jgi:DNA sulfur modification protein DndB